MTSDNNNEMDIPDELVDKLLYFQQDFEKMSEILSPMSALNINSTDFQIDPLDRARLNLVCGFALNSMFWTYLKTLGVNPQEHKIKGELERYKHFISHIKEIADKSKGPTLNKEAANRFVRNALWEPKETESQDAASSTSNTEVLHTKRVPNGISSPSRKKFEKNKKHRH